MKKTTILLFIVLPILLFSQQKRLIQKALETNDISEKIEIFSRVIEINPENLDALFYSGNTKQDKEDYIGAINDYTKIILTKPDADTYLNRGNARYSIGNLSGAMEDYQKSFDLDINLLSAKYSLGCLKYELEDYNGAFIDFSCIINNAQYRKPRRNQVEFLKKSITMRAFTHEALGNFYKAYKDYTLRIFYERFAPNANSYFNRGQLLLTLKLYDNAVKDFTTSLKLDSSNPYAYFYRGVSNILNSKPLSSIEDFNQAIKLDELDFDAYLGLAIAYNSLGNVEKAKLYFERAKSITEFKEEEEDVIEQFTQSYWHLRHYLAFKSTIVQLEKL